MKKLTFSRGFTLIELLTVVTILGVLAAFALPSFNNMITRYRITAIQDELIASLQFAKFEAVRRGTPVIITRETSNCVFDMPDSQDWHCGWRLVVDSNDNGNANANEEVIQTTRIPSGYMLGHSLPSPDKIIATKRGQFTPFANRFIISPMGIASPETRVICIGIGGRITATPDKIECN